MVMNSYALLCCTDVAVCAQPQRCSLQHTTAQGACVDANKNEFTRTWANGVDPSECLDYCSQRPKCIGYYSVAFGNVIRHCNLLGTGMGPFPEGDWKTVQNSGLGPITGVSLVDMVITATCYRKITGSFPRRHLPGLPMHRTCLLVGLHADGIHQTERPRAPGRVAAFMSAHSKTPYITPSMDVSSGNGVVRGRGGAQLGFALIHVSLLPPHLDIVLCIALTTPARMHCCCSVRSGW